MTTIIIHFTSCIFMTGLIWFVQVVHYPMLKVLDKKQLAIYFKSHIKPTVFTTFPIMLIESITALIICIDNFFNYFSVVNICGVLIIWASTFLIQVPIHNSLNKSKSLEKLQYLIKTNWIRVIIWTTRTVFIVFLSIKYFNGIE